MAEIYGHKLHTTRLGTNIELFQEVFVNEHLKKTDLRVFGFLCGSLESVRPRKIDKNKICDRLEISKKNLEESLERLLDEGIIDAGGDGAIYEGYRMAYADNPKTRNYAGFED